MPEDPSPKPSDGEKPKKLTLRLSGGSKPEPPPATPGKDPETPTAKPRGVPPQRAGDSAEPPLFIEDHPFEDPPPRPAQGEIEPSSGSDGTAASAGDRPGAPRLKLNRRTGGEPPAPISPEGKRAAKPWEPMQDAAPDVDKTESEPPAQTPAPDSSKPAPAGPQEEKKPRKPPPPTGARVIAPEPGKAFPPAAKKAPPPPSEPVAAAPPETPETAPGEEPADGGNDSDIPPDAVSNAIKAGKERPRKRRVVKLLTIAAGLAASTLAVWWSTDALPFFMPEPSPAPAAAPAANQAQSAAPETAPPAPRPAGSTEQDPAVAAFVEALRIQHVQPDDAAPRVLIGGVAYTPGSLVHEGHRLRLADVDTGSRTVVFEDASGARYPLGY